MVRLLSGGGVRTSAPSRVAQRGGTSTSAQGRSALHAEGGQAVRGRIADTPEPVEEAVANATNQRQRIVHRLHCMDDRSCCASSSLPRRSDVDLVQLFSSLVTRRYDDVRLLLGQQKRLIPAIRRSPGRPISRPSTSALRRSSRRGSLLDRPATSIERRGRGWMNELGQVGPASGGASRSDWSADVRCKRSAEIRVALFGVRQRVFRSHHRDRARYPDPAPARVTHPTGICGAAHRR